ncbi:uncharacterized protein LOC134829845 [Culicoides brevitarsis]|uniref:uncharacterized protein LOC134829845 n=1 Tax=Culicoides brevitarsis TaxID=469753 RepID=UPI00307CA870
MLKFIERDFIKVALICVLCLTALTDARKAAGAKRGGSSGSKYGGSRVSKPQTQSQPPKYANPNIASLSYSPSQQAAPMKPSAPVAPVHSASPDHSKPIGWNVGHESPAAAVNKPPVNSAPYPTNNQFNHQAPPPSYSQYPNQHGNMNGPPPPYSAQPQPGLQSRFNEAPPAYSPVGHQPNPGYPVQQPGLGQPGYPQQPGFGYPAPGGYPQQQPGFAPGGQAPTIVNNYHQTAPQGGNGGGSGLTNALLLGSVGLGAYNAFKPSGEKTVIINNTVVQQVPAENSTEMASNMSSPAVETTPVPLAAYPSSPVPAGSASEMVPLAPMPSPTVMPATSDAPAATNTEMPSSASSPAAMMPSSPEPAQPASDVTVSQLTASSLAPLTTFAAMANDAETNKTVEVPAMPPIMVPTISSKMDQEPSTSTERAMANALNTDKKLDSGSNGVRTSILTVIALPLAIWMSIH